MIHMKNILRLSLVILLSASTFNLSAQIVFPQDGGDGSVKFLKDQKILLVKYDYSATEMGDGTSEAVFLQKKQEELNAKRAARGDEYVERWNRTKKENWEFKFEELFNKYSSKLEMNQSHTEAKYTLVVKSLVTFPGMTTGMGMGGVPSYVTLEFSFVETAQPEKVLGRFLLKHVQGPANSNCGMFVDAPALCMQEAYAKAAKVFADYVKKNR